MALSRLDKPPNGTRAVWYIQNGRIGIVGHWQDGELVEDRRMTWIEARGRRIDGSRTDEGVFPLVLQRWSLLALLYALVWFVQRVWNA